MADTGGTKPFCQICGLPSSDLGTVAQRTMADGKIYYVHPWHVAVLANLITRGVPVVPES